MLRRRGPYWWFARLELRLTLRYDQRVRAVAPREHVRFVMPPSRWTYEHETGSDAASQPRSLPPARAIVSSHPAAGDGSVLDDVPRVDLHLGLGLPGAQLLEGQPQGRRPCLRNGTERHWEPRLLFMTKDLAREC